MTRPRLVRPTLALSVLLAAATPLAAQQQYPSDFSTEMTRSGPVRDALEWVDANFDAQVEEWIRITEIPAKSGFEEARAAYLVEQLQQEGVDVHVDEAGNVVARLPGTGGGPTVVFGAHMDTVHPQDTDVTVTRDGDVLRAPGIFDNSASVANMMAVIRALVRTGTRTRGDLVFVGTVEEELGYEIPLPDGGPFAVYNVGMLGGGLVTNAIPQETWFTVDLRSVEPALIDELDGELDRRVALAAQRHQVEWARDPASSPSAVVAARRMLSEPARRAHPLVQTALDAYAYLGIESEARDSGSTDAVPAVRRGIPAIAIGRANGGDQHTVSEWAVAPSALGATQAVLLIAVSMAGLPAM